MIGGRGIAEAPDDVVIELGPIGRQFAVGTIAPAGFASRAHGLTAAIAIGDDVGFIILGIDAGADPRDRRRLGAGRAGVGAAAAAVS